MEARPAVDWQPIADLSEAMKDGRPVLLWTDWSSSRARYPAAAADGTWRDEPVTARWYRPGGGSIGYWALTQPGGYAEDDEVSGKITHFAEIVAPAPG